MSMYHDLWDKISTLPLSFTPQGRSKYFSAAALWRILIRFRSSTHPGVRR